MPDLKSAAEEEERQKNLKDRQIIVSVLMLVMTLEYLFIPNPMFYTEKRKK
jgi:hypothetical protein